MNIGYQTPGCYFVSIGQIYQEARRQITVESYCCFRVANFEVTPLILWHPDIMLINFYFLGGYSEFCAQWRNSFFGPPLESFAGSLLPVSYTHLQISDNSFRKLVVYKRNGVRFFQKD